MRISISLDMMQSYATSTMLVIEDYYSNGIMEVTMTFGNVIRGMIK